MSSCPCTLQMQILHVMSFVIERMTVKIRPLAGSLIQYLPRLWADGAEHNMLRCAILTTLTALVEVRHCVVSSMLEITHQACSRDKSLGVPAGKQVQSLSNADPAATTFVLLHRVLGCCVWTCTTSCCL